MVYFTVVGPQDGRGCLGGSARRDRGFCWGRRCSLVPALLWSFVPGSTGFFTAIVPIVAGTVVAKRALLAIVLELVIARSIIARPIVSGPIISRPRIPGSIISLPVVSGSVISRPVVSGPIVPGPVERPAIGTVLVAGPVELTILTFALTPVEAILALGCRFGTFAIRRLGGFGVRRLVLEIDVVARNKLIAADDLGQRPLGLHGAHHPEIVLGVLEVVFRHHAIAGGMGVAGELLVALVDVLRGAPHLDAVRAVGIESAVGVVLRPSAPAAATVAVATALTFHSLEISHL